VAAYRPTRIDEAAPIGGVAVRRLEIEIGGDRMPVAVAGNIFARFPNGEVFTRHSFAVGTRQGAQRTIEYPLGRQYQDETCDIILNPDANAAISLLDTNEIWGAPIIFRNVPLRPMEAVTIVASPEIPTLPPPPTRPTRPAATQPGAGAMPKN